MDPPPDAWFNPLAEFLGPAYLRNAFTMGTEQEIEFLVGALQLDASTRVLDAGCGPGRHSLALARRGIEVVGVDLSPDFVELARAAAATEHLTNVRFDVHDVRALPFSAECDAVLCLCQGGFGLLGGGPDEAKTLAGLALCLKPSGRLALSAFNPYFVVRHLEPGESFDAGTGVNHELATLRDDNGIERAFDLWTTCFTPRELRMLAEAAGLRVDAISAVTPGDYAARAPSVDHPEHLLLATRI